MVMRLIVKDGTNEVVLVGETPTVPVERLGYVRAEEEGISWQALDGDLLLVGRAGRRMDAARLLLAQRRREAPAAAGRTLMAASAEFTAVWGVIKDWQIRIGDGYSAATSAHVRAILDGLRAKGRA